MPGVSCNSGLGLSPFIFRGTFQSFSSQCPNLRSFSIALASTCSCLFICVLLILCFLWWDHALHGNWDLASFVHHCPQCLGWWLAQRGHLESVCWMNTWTTTATKHLYWVSINWPALSWGFTRIFSLILSATQIPRGMLICPHFADGRVETWKSEPCRCTGPRLACGGAVIFHWSPSDCEAPICKRWGHWKNHAYSLPWRIRTMF